MKSEDIRWKQIERDALADALLFGGEPANRYFPMRDPGYIRGNITAGIAPAPDDEGVAHPSILVLGDDSATETFSWIRVYAPEAFPLSQFGRVLVAHEWKIFAQHEPRWRKNAVRSDLWASVIVGEALAQSESDIELSALPLSRSGACFSMAMARAVSIHGFDEATSLCANRLRQVEADRRFARRPISVSDLLPIWSLATAKLDSSSAEEAADLVIAAATKYFPGDDEILGSQGRAILNALGSNSVEKRVQTFNEVLTLLAVRSEPGRSGMAAAFLAGAAFLVGRGTSHLFLLRRVAKLFPVALNWFALIAALAGPRSWDPDWARACKGVERQLRTKFDWTESPGTDLSWSEFEWISMTFDSADIFAAVPKLLPRVVAIEIVPGATCQFRLSGPVSESDGKPGPDAAYRDKELLGLLSQFISLSNRAKTLLEGQTQQQLDFGKPTDSIYSKAAARARRQKKGNEPG